MCMAYEDAQKDVREGIRLLAQAKKRLADTIGDRDGSVITGRGHELSDYSLNDPVATSNELVAGICVHLYLSAAKRDLSSQVQSLFVIG